LLIARASRLSCGQPCQLSCRREKLKSSAADGLDAESFSKAFAVKVDGVRQSTAAAGEPCFTDLNDEF